jgi:uncharacterized protein YdeI (YjbR/CyaY-like superfamily)
MGASPLGGSEVLGAIARKGFSQNHNPLTRYNQVEKSNGYSFFCDCGRSTCLVYKAPRPSARARVQEQWIGFYKRNSGKSSITWPEAVDAALCFGWIDGVRKSINEASYKIRFTPRRSRSTWSAVNVKRVEELTRLGLMEAAGCTAWQARTEQRSGIYSYEQRRKLKLDPDFEYKLRAKPEAWEFFTSQPPWYQRTATYWTMSAKKQRSRLKRLSTLIEYSAKERPIPPLTRRQGKKASS